MDPTLTVVLIVAGVILVVACCASAKPTPARRAAPTSTASYTPASTAQANGHAVRVRYRTKDGRADYSFSFEQQPDGAWRAYIADQPSYQGREDDAHTTHRLSDGGRKYVCWTDPLRSLEQVKQVAAMWADATQKYIQSGTRF